MDSQVLVLDVGFQPMGLCTWMRAVTLLYEKKVEVLETFDTWLHSAKTQIRMPSVIRFLKNVIKKTRKVKFSRENIYSRDKGKCQYCNINIKANSNEFTLDHVIPKAQGGKTCYENVVVCCIECNREKACRTPEQAGLILKNKPIRPKTLFRVFNWKHHFPQSWQSYLYWNQELESDS